MQKSEDKFRVMVDTIPTLAWWSLADGSVEFFNQRWHDYTGLSPAGGSPLGMESHDSSRGFGEVDGQVAGATGWGRAG